MPIIQGTSNPLYTTTFQVQDILDSVAQDIRQQLSSQVNTAGQPILLDYLNRVNLDLLRTSRWQFLLSSPQRFVTQLGVTDYWLGQPGQNPAGTADTSLNLVDLRTIKPGTVYDRSNNVPLGQVAEAPLVAKIEFPDASSRLLRPAVWRQSPTSPQVLNIYPAPDNQNTYRPQPMPPFCTTTVAGSLPARIYWVTVSFVDSLNNESTVPRASKIFVPQNSILVVQPPQEPVIAGTTGIRYDRYNVYVSSVAEGSVSKQNGNTPIVTTQAWSEPTTGLINGAAPQTNNAVEPIDGYIIEFRYYKVRALLSDPNTVIQIPDDYRDVLIAGVNARAYQFLRQNDMAQQEMAMYQAGKTTIIRDINLHPRGQDYIRPDGATIGGYLPAVESIDTSVLSS